MASTQLTDEELYSELKRLGFTPGPVSEHTRPVYLKKLKKLREEQQQRARSGKTRNSGSINNSGGGGNSSNTAAGASGFRARPGSNDVTNLNATRSPGGRPDLNAKRSSRGGKFVLGFSSDESDAEASQKKGGPNHSGSRKDRGSALQQEIRPTGTPTAARRSSGIGVSSNKSPIGLLEARKGVPESSWWGDREKSSIRLSHSTVSNSYDEANEDNDYEEESERDSRAVNGSRVSHTSNTLVGDYSDSEEEEGNQSERERQRERRLLSRRSLPKSASYQYRSVKGSESSQERASGVSRVNGTPGNRLDMTGERGEDDDEETRHFGELVLSGSSLSRSYPKRHSFVFGDMGESSGESSNSSQTAYSKNHVDNGEDTASRSRSNIGLRPRFSTYNSISPTYRPNHSNHTSSNHAYGQASIKRKHSVPEDELLQQFKREEVTATGGFSAHYLSMFLLAAACLFFVLLGLVYVRMRGATPPGDVIKSHPFGAEFDTSYDNKEKDIILKLLLHLHDHLANIAGEHDCGDHNHPSNRSLSITQASNYLKLQNEAYEDFMMTALEWIIRTGQDVGIRLIGAIPEEPVVDVSEISRLESTHPRMSFVCRFRRAFFTVIHRVLLILAGIGIVWGLLSYMKYRWRREEEETRQMYDMVERIIDVLRSHSEACQENKDLQPYLPIPHVRDSLIQPQDRKKMKNVWKRAVAFLSADESRVRTESQRIGGADFTVWRWLQPSTSCDKMSSSPSKVWQGKAFPLDRRNSPPNSLTPCLKIRNMFDPVMEVGENWHLAIHEAILEKCSDNDGIVHIAVDKNSREGCVYVKCLSAEHSGKAFKALHGSWFDGKLVTVKYLRLDRYHQRFPQALNCNTPLKPSSSSMNSMSRTHQRSCSSSLGFS
ncbi:inner nuclear membrane protein Man1 [Chanos chanos]|uniref:Inner nuclear membrane protein Man1 n=1 Tax=Chanos chanos TaxID=29144 RepID=A0A6J2W390_CHACN|nr:inner nuclear membrane protein Man1 [Chanos chanos]